MIIEAGALEGYRVDGEIKKDSQIKLVKPNGGSYEMKIDAEGKVTCNCPASKYRGTCKHVQYIHTKLGAPTRISRTQADLIIQKVILAIRPHVTQFEVAGSYRRGKSTIKDIDIVAIGDPDKVLNALKSVDGAGEVVMSGESIIRSYVSGVQVDVRFTNDISWGATLIFYTGPKELNIKQRAEAKARGYKLNEWGLFKRDSEDYIAGRTEGDIYNAMGWEYLTPEAREAFAEQAAVFGGR